jgi:hypothetical protein
MDLISIKAEHTVISQRLACNILTTQFLQDLSLSGNASIAPDISSKNANSIFCFTFLDSGAATCLQVLSITHQAIMGWMMIAHGINLRR